MTSEPSIDQSRVVARSDGAVSTHADEPADIVEGDRPDVGPAPATRRGLSFRRAGSAGRIRDVPSRTLAFWQRSLPTRVVITTLAGSLVVLLLGGVVLMQVASLRVVGTKEASSDQLAGNAFRTAQAALDGTQFDASTTAIATLRDQTQTLVDQGSDGDLFDVIRFGPYPDPADTVPRQGTVPSSIPASLRAAVGDKSGVWSSSMQIRKVNGSTTPGYAVGTTLELPDASTAQLYLIFPLTEEERTLTNLRSAVVLAGLLLAALLTGIAFLVSRQTVSPVRAARVTAQSIAAGNLDDRMTVRGTDDFASLAVAMNEMAGELQTQIVQLEELSAMQQRFVSDVSHELRTPLTTVRMASDLIHDTRDELDPLVRRSAELLQSELDRFEVLLTDLLEISRFDAGAAALSVEAVDLSGVARRTIDAYAGFAASKGIDVRLHAEPESVRGDSRRIERIVRNLLSNAIEHGEGRPIDVVVAGTTDAVAIAVRDHGVGFEPEQAEQVFHRFWRADPSRARTIGGSGLGLAIAAEDAKLHGGELAAWGSPGEGAQFTLTLPRTSLGRWDDAPIPVTPLDLAAPLAGEVARTSDPEPES